MRVSLQIDGDASGAEKAAKDAGQAIEGLGKDAAAISKAIEDGFARAIGALKPLSDKGGGAVAANDNVANSIGQVTQKVSELSRVTLGQEAAFTKAAAGATNLTGAIGAIVRTAGALPLLGGAIGLVTTGATILLDVVNSRAKEAERNLSEHARLVGIVREAYSGAAAKAGEFLRQSKAATQFETSQNLLKLRTDLRGQSTDAVDSFKNDSIVARLKNFFSINDDGSEVRRFDQLRGAVDSFEQSVASGNPDVTKFVEQIVAIGQAAEKSDPELAKAAYRILDQLKVVRETSEKVAQSEAQLRLLDGKATPEDRKRLGVGDGSEPRKITEFDRLEKTLLRQAAAQEAEALSIGRTAGESAKLRSEYLLKEAAEKDGIKVVGEYAERVNTLADRFGKAAQKSAELRTISDLNFERSQLGRSPIDAAVADRLRPSQGDNIDLNSELATAIRFNETMKDLRTTASEVGSIGFRTLKADIDAGTLSLSSFGKVGLNALNSIIEKASSKAFENIVTGIFGRIVGSVGGFSPTGGTGFSLTGTGGLFAAGGFTGSGTKYEVAGVVHRGEYVFDQESVGRIGLPNLARMHRGFAEGGYVGPAPAPPPSARRLAATGNDNTAHGASAPQNVHVTVGVEFDDNGSLRAYVKNVSTDATRSAVSGFVGSPQFTQAVAGASVRAGKMRLGS